MKIRVKWSLERAKAKLRQWERQVDKETVEDLREYSAEAAAVMVRCTPPAHRGIKPGRALQNLKARIADDFEGDGIEAFTDEDIRWFRLPNGELTARIKGWRDGRPSPFRVVKGRVSRKALAAMNVGRYKVEFIKNDLGAWMRRSGQYEMRMSGHTYRLIWHGVRHVTTMGALRAEIRRRQHLAGKLMAGWKPFAHKVKVRLPAQAERVTGKGSVKQRRDGAHKAVMTASNGGRYPGFQNIINRQLPVIMKKNRRIAKKRAKQLRKKLKK